MKLSEANSLNIPLSLVWLSVQPSSLPKAYGHLVLIIYATEPLGVRNPRTVAPPLLSHYIGQYLILEALQWITK